ncbi:MAG TPA: hypothetical protein VFR18_02730 [Terriglobia bacterium]|nr:hypothetical protein [Terriglobia bacterium]
MRYSLQSMNEIDLFVRLTAALAKSAIPYMLTGSFASSFHGVPRASNDVDIVIAPTEEQLSELKDILSDGEYYFDLDDALDALRRRRQFNVIDLETGWKIDFIIRKSRPFSLTEFERRSQVHFEGLQLYIAQPEDIIVAKLEWAKRASSERQIEDVVGILRVQSKDLDYSYIEKWVQELDLQEQWDQARIDS